ncbi:HsdM family class I SAM-dependent methyltransferase [Fundicoccus sp. Sow4_D5]|uniref:HsdM family class I SAM-dependent methyltransferase n=1 Tax=Fundicoccus sp. Sow4_D5 TaxID=3438782 RepID=UPI003F91E152
MNKVEILKKEELGQVFTPKNVALLMAQLLMKYKPKTVLDPAVGSGVLLEAIRKVSSTVEITGYDIDGEWVEYLKNKGINAFKSDFFDEDLEFDGIIMNPPFIRQEKLVDLSKEYLNKEIINKKLGGPPISKKANLYLYFLWKALSLLKKTSNCLVAIIPNTWLNSEYGYTLQKKILTEYSLDYVVNFSKNIFKGYDVDVSIFVISNEYNYENSVRFIDINTDLSAQNIEKIINNDFNQKNIDQHIIKQKDIKYFDWFSYRNKIQFNQNNLLEFHEVFKINRGLTTNHNALFIRNKKDVKSTEIKKYFFPITNRANDIKGYKVKKTNLDKVVFLTNELKENLPTSIVEELDKFEKQILMTERPKTLYTKIKKNRTNWFHLIKKANDSIIFNYIIRDNVRFIMNNSEVIVKDNFYEIKTSKIENINIYLAVLNSTFNKYLLEYTGRSYGNGLLKIQKYELERAPILNLDKVNIGDLKKLNQLGNDLINGSDIKNTIKTIDLLLSSYYLYNEEQYEEFYNIYEKVLLDRKGMANDKNN